MFLNPFDESAKYFPTQLQAFQYYDKYSRFDSTLGRRETWVETVNRAVAFLRELSDNRLPIDVYDRIHANILTLKNMPSMRLLASAGAQARRQNISTYNCSYLPLDSIDSLVEVMTLSMNGSGVGYSVENKYVSRLPVVIPQKGFVLNHVVSDSSEGWAKALQTGLDMWYHGYDMTFDFSLVRPAGAILKTKGGHASGPEPLKNLLTFAREIILGAAGRKLTSLEVHSIACEIGAASISGGVRRTALISLFDYNDQMMLHCKDGEFPARLWNANNSAVWPDNIDYPAFRNLFDSMVAGQRGEPGIFIRGNAERSKPARRESADWGSNPCGEIFLRPFELCNLSVAVARADDTLSTLRDKVEVATIIGSIQSMATHFPGLRPVWKQNCEEERLLGVDINGQMDSPVARDPEVQATLREHAVLVNQHYAKLLGIKQSSSVTCVKPSGNSAALLNCSSGIHARWSPYYIKNVRVSAHSPLFKVLQNSEVPMSPENGQTADDAHTWVIHFPIASPDGAVVRRDRSAIQQCDYWRQVKTHWTEHNPSVTITYNPDEVQALGEWQWQNRNIIGGMAFLPADDAKYEQMPYQEISRFEYEKAVKEFPVIDFSRIVQHERYDMTEGVNDPACMSGACDIDAPAKG